ncbi:hypothetical protein LTR40_004284 [Exophiala xenobiotica]|nr:hypothetical protein LTR40_004284 [Exophiala xenobiotica]
MFYGPRVRLAALAIPERRRRRQPLRVIYDDYDSDSDQKPRTQTKADICGTATQTTNLIINTCGGDDTVADPGLR